MKQTAVQFLYDQIWKTPITEWGKLLHQAQQMEKEQIIDAHNHGFTEGTCFGASPISYKFIESEQYYNETFNTEDK